MVHNTASPKHLQVATHHNYYVAPTRRSKAEHKWWLILAWTGAPPKRLPNKNTRKPAADTLEHHPAPQRTHQKGRLGWLISFCKLTLSSCGSHSDLQSLLLVKESPFFIIIVGTPNFTGAGEEVHWKWKTKDISKNGRGKMSEDLLLYRNSKLVRI